MKGSDLSMDMYREWQEDNDVKCTIKPCIYDEYSELKIVMMVSPNGNYNPIIKENAKPINTQQMLNQGNSIPTEDEYQKEHSGVIKFLRDNDVMVISPKTLFEIDSEQYYILGANEAVHSRDSAFTIGDTFIVANLAEPTRQVERLLVNDFALNYIVRDKIIYLPLEYKGEKLIAEGGDIVIDEDTIYVGQGGLRTNRAALNFLYEKFNHNFNIVPIQLGSDVMGHPILHLDCVFNTALRKISGEKFVLIYKDGIANDSRKVLENQYEFICVTKQEQSRLGVNFLNIGNNTVIGVSQNDRLNELVASLGFNVHAPVIEHSINDGGGVRCMTCPIVREVKGHKISGK